jgi:hypothetical protein
MKSFLVAAALLVFAQSLQAQYNSKQRTRYGSQLNSSSCECTQIRMLTGQDAVVGGEQDGSQSVCRFQAFGFNNQVSFQGGWLITGDIVSYSCRGGHTGSGSVTYSSEPSPLCKVTGTQITVASPGTCVHQMDTNYDNIRSADEREAWAVKNAPITEGPRGYVGKASQMAIDYWNLSFTILLNGSNLCDRAINVVDPVSFAQCSALPVECRRLNYVGLVNPIMAHQIRNAYSGYSNSLDHCTVPGEEF